MLRRTSRRMKWLMRRSLAVVIMEEGVHTMLTLPRISHFCMLSKISVKRQHLGGDDAEWLIGGLKQMPSLTSSLTSLDLRQCSAPLLQAVAIVKIIQKFTSLTELELDGNDMGSTMLSELPSHSRFECLTSLESLAKITLESCFLTPQSGEVLAQTLEPMTCLQTVSLANNVIGLEDCWGLKAVLLAITSVTDLDLGNCKIGEIGFHWENFAAGLRTLTLLTTLRLRGNEFYTIGTARYFSEALAALSCLQILDVGYSRLGDEGAQIVVAGISRVTSLTELQFDEVAFGPQGARALSTLFGGLSSLVKLDLSGSAIGDEGAECMAASLSKLESLCFLRLEICDVAEEGVGFLAQAFRKMPSLKKLWIGSNRFGDQGCSDIIAALGEARTSPGGIQDLTLDEISFRNGVSRISESLGTLAECLASLSLCRCDMNTEAAGILARGLGRLSGLSSLSLYDNPWGDDGMDSLAQAFGKLPSVKYIRIGRNEVGDRGAARLAEELGSSTALRQLVLIGNNIGVPGATCLAESLTQLDCLDLRQNYLRQQEVELLREVWQGPETGLKV